ncbi:MAG: DUF2249 domain-containing protein, partial [Bacteroidales bacterium]|nr:DUF2249 domain-containing protein [Bacteroidales bacterium]
MQISANTKISEILKAHKKAIDVIADINPHFKKLRNPVLRKILASRVDIETAAKIGGVDPQVFFDKLKLIGFKPVNNTNTDNKQDNNIKNKNMVDINSDKITVLDVRDDLAKGIDPFNQIMETVKNFKEGDILKIVNTFEPSPIINVLKQKGFISRVEHISDKEIHTYLQKIAEDKSEEINKQAIEKAKTDDLDAVLASFKENFKEIDVRDLEMPEPMVKILEELKQLPDNFALYVHHKKVPQFLLPQLDERGYVYL